MDEIQQFKEKEINNYISLLDLDNIDIEQIKRDLQAKIDEEPAIQLNYEKETILNESTSEEEEVEELTSMTIIFTVNRNIGGQDIPFPIQKKILLK